MVICAIFACCHLMTNSVCFEMTQWGLETRHSFQQSLLVLLAPLSRGCRQKNVPLQHVLGHSFRTHGWANLVEISEFGEVAPHSGLCSLLELRMRSTTRPLAKWNLILAHLEHSKFNIVYISHSPGVGKLVQQTSHWHKSKKTSEPQNQFVVLNIVR